MKTLQSTRRVVAVYCTGDPVADAAALLGITRQALNARINREMRQRGSGCRLRVRGPGSLLLCPSWRRTLLGRPGGGAIRSDNLASPRAQRLDLRISAKTFLADYTNADQASPHAPQRSPECGVAVDHLPQLARGSAERDLEAPRHRNPPLTATTVPAVTRHRVVSNLVADERRTARFRQPGEVPRTSVAGQRPDPEAARRSHGRGVEHGEADHGGRQELPVGQLLRGMPSP